MARKEDGVVPATRKIIWLASYPKSGNTWLRAFLANYLIRRPPGVALPLAELNKMTRGDADASAINRILGRDHLEADAAEVYAARQRMIERLAELPTPTLVKTHLPNSAMFGVPVIPPGLTRCAIYIVRNPLDLVISYADHMAMDLEAAARAIATPANSIGYNDLFIRQILGDWSMHVRSWQAARHFPVLFLRYEDILADPAGSFTRIIRHIGAPLNEAILRDTIAVTSFDSLRASEEAEGFAERLEWQEKFFRKGTKDQWQDALPPAIADKIRADHGQVMRQFGYL